MEENTIMKGAWANRPPRRIPEALTIHRRTPNEMEPSDLIYNPLTRMKPVKNRRSIIKRIIGVLTRGQLLVLAVLFGLFAFFLKDEPVKTILIVLITTACFSLFVLMFGKVIFDEPYDPNTLPTEPDPGRNKFYSVFYGSPDD